MFSNQQEMLEWEFLFVLDASCSFACTVPLQKDMTRIALCVVAMTLTRPLACFFATQKVHLGVPPANDTSDTTNTDEDSAEIPESQLVRDFPTFLMRIAVVRSVQNS